MTILSRLGLVGLLATGCASEGGEVAEPVLDALTASAGGGKADGLADEVIQVEKTSQREVIEVRGEPAQIIFDALAGSDLYDEELVDDILLVRAPGIDCASNAFDAACLAEVFDAGLHPEEAFFYSLERPNTPQSIEAALELSPDVEVVDPFESKRIGRLRCMVIDPPALGVPDICFVTAPAEL